MQWIKDFVFSFLFLFLFLSFSNTHTHIIFMCFFFFSLILLLLFSSSSLLKTSQDPCSTTMYPLLLLLLCSRSWRLSLMDIHYWVESKNYLLENIFMYKLFIFNQNSGPIHISWLSSSLPLFLGAARSKQDFLSNVAIASLDWAPMQYLILSPLRLSSLFLHCHF